jgi:hypothetical protein
MESLREEVARLTSLLKHALRSKSEEVKFIAQPEPMLVNPQNLGAIGYVFSICSTSISHKNVIYH